MAPSLFSSDRNFLPLGTLVGSSKTRRCPFVCLLYYLFVIISAINFIKQVLQNSVLFFTVFAKEYSKSERPKSEKFEKSHKKYRRRAFKAMTHKIRII